MPSLEEDEKQRLLQDLPQDVEFLVFVAREFGRKWSESEVVEYYACYSQNLMCAGWHSFALERDEPNLWLIYGHLCMGYVLSKEEYDD